MSKKLNTSGEAARFSKLSEAVEKEQKTVERTEIIPIDAIVMNKDNIFSSSDTEESIAALAKNIEENGLLHNIVVAETDNNKYLLISGERRTKAMKYLGRDKIKATVRKNLSEFEVLKMLFFANSETREYSTEEKIGIIDNFQKKLDKYENRADKEAVKRFREYISQAFKVNERQASKLITITEELTGALKLFLFSDIIDINTAASLAQLPEEYQLYAASIIRDSSQDDAADSRKTAAERASAFSKQVKSIISKTNNVLAKDRTSKKYHNERLEKALNELSDIETGIGNGRCTIEQKEEKELVIGKYKEVIGQLEKKIDDEIMKQDEKVRELFEAFELDEIGKIEKNENDDGKKIEREVKKAEKAVTKLMELLPSDKLYDIKKLLDEYKREI